MKRIICFNAIAITIFALANCAQAKVQSNNSSDLVLGSLIYPTYVTALSNGCDSVKNQRWVENERWIERTLAKAGFNPDVDAQEEIVELQRAKEQAEMARQDAQRAVEDAAAQAEQAQKQGAEEVERAQQDAKRAFEAATRQMELAQEQSQDGSGDSSPSAPAAPAAPFAPRPPARRHPSAHGYGYSYSSSGRSDQALVIRSTPADAKTMAASEEDLNIMGRILEKSLDKTGDDDEDDQAMGIHLITMSSGFGHMRRLQIEGYGAMFMLGVNFPLVGPAAKTTESETKESSNSTWDEAKHEVYGRPADVEEDSNGDAKEKFDEKRVEKLKDSLIAALKNASNMRNLKSDESVTVVVTSGGGGNEWFDMSGLQQSMVTLKRSLAGLNSSRSAPIAVSTTSAPERPGTSVLTIRARKSDIDSFAKGKLTLEEFRNKVTVLVY